MDKKIKAQLKQNLLDVLDDIKKQADHIIDSVGDFCVDMQIVIRGFGPVSIPEWVISFVNKSESFIVKSKKKGD